MRDRPESEFDREFRALYTRHSAFVRHVLVRFGVPRANLDDVAQEVFLAVSKKLPDFEQRSDIKTWIFAICRYKASEERRRPYHKFEQPVAELEAPSPGVEPQQALERRIDSELLDRALSRLSEVQRQVFVRRVIDGESVAEIASGLGDSPFTIYARLSVAARKVQTFVEKRCGMAAWLFLIPRSGERRGAADALATSAAPGLRRGFWHSPMLDALLPFAAAVFVVMTPLASGLPRSGPLARARTPAAVTMAHVEVKAPARIESNGAPALQPAKVAEPHRRERKRAPRPKATRPAQLETATPVVEEAPPPPPEPEREQEILWRSRFALDTNPDKALALTDEHAALHPSGLLTEEREVLAIEALLRLRRMPTALERARRFTAAYPDSPYARPVHQLIERLSLSPRRLSVADSR